MVIYNKVTKYEKVQYVSKDKKHFLKLTFCRDLIVVRLDVCVIFTKVT